MSELHSFGSMRRTPLHPFLADWVKNILDLLASGASRKEILDDYPYLEDADVTAALEFAARQSDRPVLTVT